VSHGADGKTIRQNWLELAETLPQRAFTIAVETGLVSRNRESQLAPRPKDGILGTSVRGIAPDTPSREGRACPSPLPNRAPVGCAVLADCQTALEILSHFLSGAHITGE